MIIRQEEQRTETREKMRSGNLTVGIRHFLEQDQSAGAGRMFAVATIPPGGSIGPHKHEGDFEVYYILRGAAHVTDNGEPGVLHPGDCMLCRDGDSHSIENRGAGDLEFVALVLYGK